MYLRTLIAVEAVALPVGLGALDWERAILLALLVALSVGLFFWMFRASREHTRVMAQRRHELRKNLRSIR